MPAEAIGLRFLYVHDVRVSLLLKKMIFRITGRTGDINVSLLSI